MPNWLNGNIIQILIVLLFVGSSFFGWVVKELQKQAERKRMEAEIQRRRTEALRTGRVEAETKPAAPARTTASQTPAQPASLEEIAARRQAQLDELRRRRAQQAAQQAARQRAQASAQAGAPAGRPQTQPVPVQRRTPAPPQRSPRQPQATRPQAGTTQGGLRPVQAPTRPRQAPAPVAAPKRRRPQPERVTEHVQDHGFDELSAKARPAFVHHDSALMSAVIPARLTHADMRRAIVLSEILAPPVSMRPAHDEY